MLHANSESLVKQAAERIRSWLGTRQPRLAIVLGSGLGILTDILTGQVVLPYSAIPGFPEPTVQGHQGNLVAGKLAGREILAQSGRFHLHEGHSAEVVSLPPRVFARLGIDTIIFTNAAGAIRRTLRVGTLMLVADHINLTFRNPLIGGVLQGEERFPDMSDPYDNGLRSVTREAARLQGIELAEGVYAGMLGPSYETQAEVRMLDRLGADAVGMSTVLEVIAARAGGVRCLAISTITNMACGLGAWAHGRAPQLSHDEVMECAKGATEELQRLVEGVVERC